MPTVRPNPVDVARTAADIMRAITTDPEYPRLLETCRRYDQDRTCLTGTLTISEWDIADDAGPLINEALRALALKSAIFRLTGDEHTAEIPIARPVDEVLHAVLAQRTLTERMAARHGITFVHMTDTEVAADGYEPGDYTTACYAKAYGAEPPGRYWLSADEHARRVAILDDRFAQVGVRDLGHRHAFTFN
ncbi:hypothetical protein BJF79_03550 [Actinomadura sp. CNU-125]|uniref:hypothetical protein n=1 Tax=Actinomadura sp. CNU-125 TaxID=1904961 RepID=UPI000960A772|nr:hypothetical protein [Actinomadura sp. CNU-125]OLT12987.1 hypothetical protein BJF79_03550 [Actinomadura sp. CNU-125]